MIVVVIVHRPSHANGITVADGWRRGVETRLLDPADVHTRICAHRLRQRLVTGAGLHRDLIEIRCHVFGQIVQGDTVYARSGLACTQHGFPLNKPCRWNADLGIFKEINFFPGTPVAIGIIYIAAARE